MGRASRGASLNTRRTARNAQTIPSKCCIVWQIQSSAMRSWRERPTLPMAHFDQCQLGQCVPKSTVIATDLPLKHWDGLVCDDAEHVKYQGVTSADLSRPEPSLPTFPQRPYCPHRGTELTACNPLWGVPLHRFRADLRTLQFWFDLDSKRAPFETQSRQSAV